MTPLREAHHHSHFQPSVFLILRELSCALSHTRHNKNRPHVALTFDASSVLFRNGNVAHFDVQTENYFPPSGISGNGVMVGRA